MAIDPNLAPASSEKDPISIIENEIPAYRAISSAAIFSLLLGLASVFCFTNLGFVGVSLAAIVVGVIAIRNIARRPDILTGASFAKVGIALGLIFGISAVTSSVVQGVMLTSEATQFANTFVDVLKKEPLAVAIWFHQPPSTRNSRKPDELVAELKQSSSQGPGGDQFELQSSPIIKIKAVLQNEGADLHLEKIESTAVVGLTSYANALIELHGAGGKELPEEEKFALLRLRKDPSNRRGEWTVEEMNYPYKPQSYVEKVHAPDDGHGH